MKYPTQKAIVMAGANVLARNRWLPVAIMMLATGCSGGSDVNVAPVTGQVTLDGKPLAGAQVIFRPKEGRPSTGITDDTGNYMLQYSRDQAGALVGAHTVEIQTAIDGRDPPSSEKLPPRYNRQTELTEEVTPDGNTINFALKSES